MGARVQDFHSMHRLITLRYIMILIKENSYPGYSIAGMSESVTTGWKSSLHTALDHNLYILLKFPQEYDNDNFLFL